MVLNQKGAPHSGGVKKFPGRPEPLAFLQHGKLLNGNVFLPKVRPVLILRRYILSGLVPEEMEIWVKFLEILQAEFEPAYENNSGCLVGMPRPFRNNICSILAFGNRVHIKFQGSRLHRRAARLIPNEHECIHFAQLHAA